MKILFGALVYLVGSFPLAFFRHLKRFEKKYMLWEYAGSSPNITLGFTSMLIQGGILSYLYASATIDQTSTKEGLIFVLTLGILSWSHHVVAAMAKNEKLRNKYFFIYETVFIVIQFSLFGLLISSLVY